MKPYVFIVVEIVNVFNRFSVQLLRKVAESSRHRLSSLESWVWLRSFIFLDGRVLITGSLNLVTGSLILSGLS